MARIVDTAGGPLTNADLDRNDGSNLGYHDRFFTGYRDDKFFDYGDWVARDLAEMMRKPGKHRQIEAVLSYPTTAAERSFVSVDKAGKAVNGNVGEGTDEVRDWLQNFFSLDEWSGGCEQSLDLVIDQMTSAVTYKKSFHEIEWSYGEGDYAAQVIPKSINYRPQTTTRLLRDPNNSSKPWAIEQDQSMIFQRVMRKRDRDSSFVTIPMRRVLLHINGDRRDPINGLSDLEVPFWAHKTSQKILFLWMQFAENVAIPGTVVKSNDQDTSLSVARSIADSNGGGVIPVATDGRPDSVMVDVLNRAGSGGDEFQKIMAWLGQESVNAVLAGFLNLTNNEKSGGGWALSSDSSDFFMMTLEGKNRGYERSVRSGLFAPMVRQNFGPKAPVPSLKFEPLTSEDKSTAVAMLQSIIAAYATSPQLIPDELTTELVRKVSDYVGMDSAKLEKAFTGASQRAADLAKQNSPAGASPAGQAIAQASGAAGAAVRAVDAAKKGKDPVKAAKKAPTTPKRAR